MDDLFCRVRPLVTATDASSQRTTEMEKALKEMSDRVGRYTPLGPEWATKLEAKLHVLESTFGEKLKLADEKSEMIMHKLSWCMNEVTVKVKELETGTALNFADVFNQVSHEFNGVTNTFKHLENVISGIRADFNTLQGATTPYTTAADRHESARQ